MKKTMLITCVSALVLSACKREETKTTTVTTTTTVTDTVVKETAAAEQPMDSAAMMKAWEEYAKPGDAHAALAAEVGKWNCRMTFWQGPDAKPEQATSTADVKMVFGGKYQEAYYKGMMMGMPFEGKSVTGFNNASGKAFSTFYDNMGTGIMQTEGTYDAATKTFRLSGEMTDAMTKKTFTYREEYAFVDENTRKMTMYDNKGGSEYKSMEIVMTRMK